MISTSGFTEGTVTMARARDYDQNVYRYGERRLAQRRGDCSFGDPPWAPLSDRVCQISNHPFDLPQNVPFPKIELFTPAGEPLGRVDVIVDKLWIDEVVPHEEGTHTLTLVDHAVIPVEGKECPCDCRVDRACQAPRISRVGASKDDGGPRRAGKVSIDPKDHNSRNGFSRDYCWHRSRVDGTAKGGRPVNQSDDDSHDIRCDGSRRRVLTPPNLPTFLCSILDEIAGKE